MPVVKHDVLPLVDRDVEGGQAGDGVADDVQVVPEELNQRCISFSYSRLLVTF